jgi:hypothetical protein
MACWRSPEARWGVRRLVDVIRVVRHRLGLWWAITATREWPVHVAMQNRESWAGTFIPGIGVRYPRMRVSAAS